MKELSSSYGRVLIGSPDDCFRTAVFLAEGQRGRQPRRRHFTCALSGGGTPQTWYRWCVAQAAWSPGLLATAHWFVSDERYVRIDSYESNFGSADRLLLRPLGIPAERKHPWSTGLPPGLAAIDYGRLGAAWFGPRRTFDVCFLGLGADGHTASIFPGSPLLAGDGGQFFAAVDVPDRGWRLTVTPSGLRAAGLLVVLVLGADKADILHQMLTEKTDPVLRPAQLLRDCAPNTVWLVDEAAAARFLAG